MFNVNKGKLLTFVILKNYCIGSIKIYIFSMKYFFLDKVYNFSDSKSVVPFVRFFVFSMKTGI